MRLLFLRRLLPVRVEGGGREILGTATIIRDGEPVEYSSLRDARIVQKKIKGRKLNADEETLISIDV